MIKFMVGNNWDYSLLDKMSELNAKYSDVQVVELYGSIRLFSNYIYTARPKFRVTDLNKEELENFSKHALELGIGLNYTANGPIAFPDTMKKNHDQIIDFLEYISKLGFMRVTISNMLTAEIYDKIITDRKLPLKLELSTIYRVQNPENFLKIKDRIPLFNKHCVDVFKNRDFIYLKKFVKVANSTNIDLELIANEFCIHDCIDRAECYQIHQITDTYKDSRIFGSYPQGRCIVDRWLNPIEWLKSRFILPQDLKKYVNIGINHFKITGRTHPTNYITWVVEQYMKQNYEGNLLALWAHLENIGKKEEDYKPPRYYIDTKEVVNILDKYLEEKDFDENEYLQKILDKSMKELKQ